MPSSPTTATLVRIAHTVAELRKFADEHLLYEIWTTASLAARLERHARLFDGGLSVERDGPIAAELLELPGRNADIESFAMHVDFGRTETAWVTSPFRALPFALVG
jgi:hypothetical protein